MEINCKCKANIEKEATNALMEINEEDNSGSSATWESRILSQVAFTRRDMDGTSPRPCSCFFFLLFNLREKKWNAIRPIVNVVKQE